MSPYESVVLFRQANAKESSGVQVRYNSPFLPTFQVPYQEPSLSKRSTAAVAFLIDFRNERREIAQSVHRKEGTGVQLIDDL